MCTSITKHSILFLFEQVVTGGLRLPIFHGQPQALLQRHPTFPETSKSTNSLFTDIASGQVNTVTKTGIRRSGCGAFGRAVASDTKGQQFESSLGDFFKRTFVHILSSVLKRQNKETDAHLKIGIRVSVLGIPFQQFRVLVESLLFFFRNVWEDENKMMESNSCSVKRFYPSTKRDWTKRKVKTSFNFIMSRSRLRCLGHRLRPSHCRSARHRRQDDGPDPRPAPDCEPAWVPAGQGEGATWSHDEAPRSGDQVRGAEARINWIDCDATSTIYNDVTDSHVS